MKKPLLVLSALALGTSLSMNAQVQRISLFEEFTGENCNPCAATNPGITTLANTNYSGPKKLILLRYQVAIPSAPSYTASLYQQNPTEPTNRQSYYYPSSANEFAPQGRFNGRELGLGAGQTAGHAGYLDQPTIDGDYQVNAPFALTTNYAWNATYDSITITTNIQAAQAFTTTNPLKLRMAIIEEHIHYPSAPGSNGEKDFEFVMRKMVPDINGQALAGTWTNGQTQTIVNTVKLPTYIWNKGEVAVVAFIQEDVPTPPNTQNTVHQAAYGNPQPLALDATTTVLSGVSASACTPSFTPTVTIQNAGVTTLTSCTINYKIDNGTVMTQNWTGSLATGATDVVTLPMQTTTAGTHTFTVYTSNPNGSADNNANNDSKNQTFIVFGAPGLAPISQPFSNTGIPAGYSVYNPDGGYTWARVTSAGGCLKYDAWTNGNVGDMDHFYVPRLDFTGMNSMQIRFDVAYRPYDATNYETLDMLVSTDCGSTWTNLYSKASTTLATGAAQTGSAYTPTTAASNWRTETVSLGSYDGMSDVLIDFRVTNGYGNNLYLDNINVASNPVGILENNALSNVSVYPNPANTNATIKVTSANAGTATIVVYNALGQQVSVMSEKTASGVNTFDLNTAALANGLYTISVSTEGGKTIQKMTVSH